MSGINVLSDSLSGGSKLAKTSSLKGNNATDSLADTMVEFAALLGGLTNMNADPMGQNSKIGRDLEAGQDPDPLVQNLGYSHFVLSFLSQPNDLSNLPAGKEANSGNGVNQGTGEGLLADDNLSMVLANKLSLDSNEVFGTKGMTSQILQGNNPGTSELDKYRQVITDLLVVLSGQITESSSGGAILASERATSERQEMIKLMQGWLASNTLTIEGQDNSEQSVGYNEGYISLQGSDLETSDNEADLKILNPSSTSKDANIDSSSLANTQSIHSKNILSQGAVFEGVADLQQMIASTVKDLLKGMDGSAESEPNLSLQEVIKPLLEALMNEQGTGSRELSQKTTPLLTVFNQMLSRIQETNLPPGVIKEAIIPQPKNDSHVPEPSLTATTASKDTVFTDSKQKSAEIDQLHSKPFKEESSELSGVKTSQTQNLNLGIGLDGKILTGNVADGKTVTIPVWEQISNSFREQVSSRNQELKELDIQLHPADLGRIRIGLRWENGQVHLQVHASEAATGQILQNQLPELRNTLTNQGVNCGMLQMGQQGTDQQHNQNHQGDQFYKTPDSYTNQIEDEEQFTVVNSSSHGELNHRINVTA